MDRVEKPVFLSYRRTNFPWARAIYENLTQHGFDVFFDFEGISSGDFEQVILENIGARAHFIVLLTPSALERCNEPQDWLRREIEAALADGRNIVPLFLEGFSFGSTGIGNQLTGALGELRKYNWLNVPPDYFDEAMEHLRTRYLNIPLTAVLRPASAEARRSAAQQNAAANAAPKVQKQELSARQWLERGLSASDPDEKLRCYSQSIELNPEFADAFVCLGVVQLLEDNYDGAVTDFTEAIRLKPDFALAFLNRGIARRNKGDLDGALQDYDEAIRLKPDTNNAFAIRAFVRYKKGDMDGAIRDYDEAIRLKPDSTEAVYDRGVLRHYKGDMDGAIEDLTEAIRLKPDYAEALNERGRVRDEKGDLDGALEDYSQAIRLKPDFAEAFGNRAHAESKMASASGDDSKYRAAIADYQKCVDLGGVLRGGDQAELEQTIRASIS
jgi:tetratricopeptide (TPR) repeat protein